MSLIWRGGTAADTNRSPMTQNQALAGRISLTVLLVIGIIYLMLVILTLRHFGDQMDEEWQQRLARWVGDAQRGKSRAACSRTCDITQRGYEATTVR